MNAQVFILGVTYGQLLAGGSGGGGGDEPRQPRSVHEQQDEGPYQCPVCKRRFKTEKAVHGHMRSHPERAWRGMEEPRQGAGGEIREYRYSCEHCGVQFETRQALGGHRASHNGKMGCFWLSRQQQQEEEEEQQPRRRPPVLPFDLNDPAPEEQPDDDEEE